MVLFKSGKFKLHSGEESDWKIDCDALDEEDWVTLANIAQLKMNFSKIISIPRGGLALGEALHPNDANAPVIIVDDVLTTGRSMEEYRKKFPNANGLVAFARRKPASWIRALWVSGDVFENECRKVEKLRIALMDAMYDLADETEGRLEYPVGFKRKLESWNELLKETE